MKSPIYNSQERFEIIMNDTTIAAARKLNLAVLHLLRDFDRTFRKLLNMPKTYYPTNQP